MNRYPLQAASTIRFERQRTLSLADILRTPILTPANPSQSGQSNTDERRRVARPHCQKFPTAWLSDQSVTATLGEKA